MADNTVSKLDDSYLKLIKRIEWVVVSRNETITTDPNWKFDVVVFAEKNGDTLLTTSNNASILQSVETVPTSNSLSEINNRNNQYLYYDKSNDRCGWRVINDDGDDNNNKNQSKILASNHGTEHPKSNKRKRKDDDFWKIRYYYNAKHPTGTKLRTDPTSTQLHTDNTKQSSELKIEDQYVDPRHLIPIYTSYNKKNTASFDNTNIPILVTDTTDLYRLLAASQIHLSTDMNDTNIINNYQKVECCSVLEIGSSTGMTSEIVWKQLHQHNQHRSNDDSMYQQRWIGFDTGAEMIQVVQKKYKSIYSNKSNNTSNNNTEWAVCYNMDPLLDPDTASTIVREYLGPNNDNVDTNGYKIHYVTVLVDIGGNREENAVLRMIDWVLRTFLSISTHQLQLHQIILKSESLYTTLSTRNNLSTESPLAATDWYINRLRIALRESLPKHPLQAPKRFVPMHNNIPGGIGNNDNGNQKTLICRYHNYHKAGCAKIDNDKGTVSSKKRCPYDHDHCHLCLMVGHIARNCPLTS